jgi:hypothetical protein
MAGTLDVAEKFGKAVLEIADDLGASAHPTNLRFGDTSLCLKYRSPTLSSRFGSALGHLTSNDAVPALCATVWEPAPADTPLPPFPWPQDIYRGCGEMPGYSEGRVYIHFDVAMRALTVVDIATGRACYVNRAPEALPEYECAGPLRWLFHCIAVNRGGALVHAGAVAHGESAAIVTGPRGAGKSTTVLSCVAAGLSYLGDDRCLVQNNAGPWVFSVYSSAKVLASEIDRFPIPGLQDAAFQVQSPVEPKIVVQIDRIAPHQMANKARIACIICPVVTGAPRSRLVRMPTAEAIRLLLAEIVGYSPVTARRSLSNLIAICRQRPAYRLEAGTNLREVADVVAHAIERA